MKKLLYICVGMCLTALFVRCTLMMDDLSIPEEEQGIDEECTVETPYGDVTYQYNDDVTPLNGSVLDYVVALEHDTILYLMDNIPSKFLPKPGGFVASNCSRTIPMGLNHRVLSVEDVGGLYKLVLTPAERADVYKVFKVNIDFDYDVPALEMYDSLELDSMGISLDDSTMVDLSLFDEFEDPEAFAARRTRSDKNKDTTITYSYSKSFKNASLNVTIKSTEHKKFHFYEDSERDYREEWTDSWSEKTHTMEIGFGTNTDKTSLGVGGCGSPSRWKESLRKVRSDFKDKDCPWNKFAKSLVCKDLCIPIPTTPVSILIDFEAKVYIDVHAFGNFSRTVTSETRRVGAIVDQGKKTEIDEVVKEEPKAEFFQPYFGGTFDIYGRVRAGVGFLIGKAGTGAGAVIGLEVKAGIKGGCETEFLGESDVIDRENVYIEPYFNIGGYGKGVLMVFGHKVDMGSFNFLTHTKSHKYTLSPQVDEKRLSKHYSVVEYQADEEQAAVKTMKFSIDIGFSKVSSFYFYEMSKRWEHPAIRIYSGDLKDKKFVTITDDRHYSEANQTYHFEVIAAEAGVTPADEYHVIPCIHETYYNVVNEYRNHDMVFGAGAPSFKNCKITQWYGEDLTEDAAEFYTTYYGEDGERRGYFAVGYQDYAEYAFSTTVELKNARAISEWGFICKVYNKNDKLLLTKNLKFDYGDGVWASGKYTLITTFISNVKPAECWADGLYVTMQPWCEYVIDGDKQRKEGARTSGYTLRYPYRREGGPYSPGKVTSINLNME